MKYDIVIGNPPYIQIQKLSASYKKALKNRHYYVHTGTGDIYCLFYEQGINMLKPGGHLCYITSSSWLKAGYGEKLRGFFSKHNPKIVIDLGAGVFEGATVNSCILLIQNSENMNLLRGLKYDKPTSQKEGDIQAIMKAEGKLLSEFGRATWIIEGAAVQELKKKLDRENVPLWTCVKIFADFRTGLNEAFTINQETRDEVCLQEPRSEEIILPVVKSEDIKKYYHEWNNSYLIASSKRINIPKLYPAVDRHLQKYKEELLKRSSEIPYYNFNAQWSVKTLRQDKITWSRISNKIKFCLLNKEKATTEPFIIKRNVSLFYLLGMLNSKLLTKYIDWGIPKLRGDSKDFRLRFIEQVPIPRLDTPRKIELSEKIADAAEIIHYANKVEPGIKVNRLMEQIDSLVYEMYGLTEEEIEIIEGI